MRDLPRIWCITDDNGIVSNHFTVESALLALIDLSGPLHEGDATSKASEELQQEAHDLQFGGPLHPFRPFKDNAHMGPTDKTKTPHEN